MNEQDLKRRTKQFALKVVSVADALPRSRAGDVIARQMIRAATSVGANYRSACRGRSRADFASKIGISEEEADETAYWLELALEGGMLTGTNAREALQEANELTAILAASAKTARTTPRAEQERRISFENRRPTIKNPSPSIEHRGPAIENRKSKIENEREV